MRCNRFDKKDEELEKKDEELERLLRLVRYLELEVKGRHRRKDHEERGEGSTSVGGRYEAGSHQSGSHRHRDCLQEYVDRDSISPEEQQPQNAAMNAISHALHRAARSPFSRDIERAPMPRRFMRPPFNSFDRKTDPVEHVSHYI